MACNHRFLGKHTPNSLFPDWPVKYLFIGTFNPEWNRPKRQNAEYFYGRSKHFWNAMKIFFNDNQPIDLSSETDMIDFCRSHSIGFTDLITSVDDADVTNLEHVETIHSVKDIDLEKFEEINWNTDRIIEYLELNNTTKVYFTLLSSDRRSLFSREIEAIELEARRINVKTYRLHSPTGMGLGIGSPQLNKLVRRWSASSSLPLIDTELYPYSLTNSGNKPKVDKQLGTNDLFLDHIVIESVYELSISRTGKAQLIDLRNEKELKVLPTLINIIVPLVQIKYGLVINLNASNGNSPKNTRTLAKEVLVLYRDLLNL